MPERAQWRRRRYGIAVITVIGLALVTYAGVRLLQPPAARFLEYPLRDRQAAPIAIAAAGDGSIWFTIDHADAIGRWRGGRVEWLPTPGPNFDPLGLAVAADGSAWYTDLAAGAIVRMAPSGQTSQFALGSPIVRLGRLAVAPDGSVWFADVTGYGITELNNGTFKQHAILAGGEGPYGVAVAADGTVWATVQKGSKLVRIAPGGSMEMIDLPRRDAVPTDIAVAGDGAVFFLEFRANRLGRLRQGEFSEFAVASENAGLSGLAVAPDGSVWFGMVRHASLGRLRDGKVETFRLPRANARPYSVAVDRGGNVWYADISGYIGALLAGDAAGP